MREEGFERIWRRPEALRGAPRRERLPRTGALDWSSLPSRIEARHAGLLLVLPDLVFLDLPQLVAAAGYPGTTVVPAISSLLSLLALKLASTRRVSHVEDLATDPGAALFAGLSSLPKTTALTTYSLLPTGPRGTTARPRRKRSAWYDVVFEGRSGPHSARCTP